MAESITIKEELTRYLRNRRVHDRSLAALAYISGSAGVFCYALMDAALCANGAPMVRREKLNPPKQRRQIYRGVESIVRKCRRHIPEASQDEFFGLVRLLKDGEQVSPVKANLVRGVLRGYLNDYLGGVRAWQLGYLPVR